MVCRQIINQNQTDEDTEKQNKKQRHPFSDSFPPWMNKEQEIPFLKGRQLETPSG